jgi:acyl carrier protein
MNRDEARRCVHEALLQVVPDADLEHLADDVPLRDALELDSLDFLSFVEQLSASTGVRLDEVDYPRLTTTESCVLHLSGAAVG